MDTDQWMKTIDRCIGPHKKYSAEQRETLAITLLDGIEKTRILSSCFFATTQDVKFLKKQIHTLRRSLQTLQDSRSRLPIIYGIEGWASTCYEQRFGSPLDIDSLTIYAGWLEFWAEFTQGTASKPGPDNREPLLLCHMICIIYEGSFGEAPTISDGDVLSGSETAGTPYERVCRAVGELANVKIAWSTCRQAQETYREGFPAMKMIISTDNLDQMSSIQKLIGSRPYSSDGS